MTALPLLLALVSGPALAGEDLGDLLDKIPDIETRKAADEEAAPPPSTLDEDLGQVPLPEYVNQVQAHVLASFRVPKKLAKKHAGTSIQLMVKITSSGKVGELRAVALSGDKKLDKLAVEAVQAAAPLPVPPIVLRQEAMRGLVIELPIAAP